MSVDVLPPPSFARRLVAAGATLLLGACATSYGPGNLAPGSHADDAVRRMGPPTGRYTLDDGGTRLEFARGPMGLHTYMVDVDAAGRLVRVEQVLTERNFYALRPGMTADEVLRRIGRPSDQRDLPRQRHRLWSYRYETPFCIWFQVSLGEDNRVAELGHNLDPMCEDRDRGG